MKNILIIAGEASSDMHAANLVNDIHCLDKDIRFFGLGGEQMKAAGVELLENIVHLAFIGPGGLFKNYIKLRRIYNSLCRYSSAHPPDAAILIDYAEFNLRVAEHLKKLNVPIIYYISPQVWAWGKWRIKTIKRLVDKMLVFFKFEEELYREYGVGTSFVGHPLLDMVKTTDSPGNIIKRLNKSASDYTVGILPGSRKSEINNILPIMLDACALIANRLNGKTVEFVMPVAPTIEEADIQAIIGNYSFPVRIAKNDTYNVLSICDAAMVASGTATLETALMGIPMAIIYKVNLLTYILTKNLITLPYIGMVNIIAGKKAVREFLQSDARPNDIADHMVSLLTDKQLVSSMNEEFRRIRSSLGEPGARKRAAAEVVGFFKKTRAY